MKHTLLTTKELAARIRYSPTYINAKLRDPFSSKVSTTFDPSRVRKYYSFGND